MWSLLVLLPLAATTQEPTVPLRPRADFLSPVVRHSLHLSTDGQHFGYLQPDGAGVDQLHVAAVDTPGDTQVITSGQKPVLQWRWAHSGEHLLFTRKVEAGEAHLHVFTREGATTTDLTPDAAGPVWLAGHGRQWPTHVALEFQPEGEEHGIWLVDFVSKERHRMCDGGFEAYAFDGNMWPMGASGQGRIARMQKSGKWAEVASLDPLAAKVSGLVSGDFGGDFLFCVAADRSDRTNLRAIDLETGEVTLLAEHPRADLLPFGFQLDARTYLPVSMAAYRGGLERVLVDPLALARVFGEEEAVTQAVAEDWEVIGLTLEGEVHFAGQDAGGQRWLLAQETGGHRTFHVYDRQTLDVLPLVGEVPALDGATLASRRPFPVIARDGLELPCQLYLPPGGGEQPLPTVVYVHGGPWSLVARDDWSTHRHLQLLASRGYAVLGVEFRGAVGHGRAFLDAGTGQLGAAMIDDVVDATRAAVEAGVASKDALAIFGHSYGGYAVLRAMTREPGLFACGISMAAISDLHALQANAQDRPGWAELWNPRAGDPSTEAGAKLLKEQSPLHAAADLGAPLLMAHGAVDLIVPKKQSADFARGSHVAGRPVTYLVFSKEPHMLRRTESWQAFWAVGERFLAQHLGGAHQDYDTDLPYGGVVIATGATLIPGLAEASR